MSVLEINSRADLLGLMREAMAQLVAESPQVIVDALSSNSDAVRSSLERAGFVVTPQALGQDQPGAASLADDVAGAYRQALANGAIQRGFGVRYRNAVRSIPYVDMATGRSRRTYLYGDALNLAEAWFRAFFQTDKVDPQTGKTLRALTDEVNKATRAPTFPFTGEAGTGGGFLVPTAIAAEIYMEMAERFVLQTMVQVFTSAAPLQVPRRVGRINVTRGGPSTNVGEQNIDATLGALKLSPERVSAMAYVDPQLALASVVGPVRYVISQFAEAMAADKQRVIIAGDPTLREPRGINTLPTAAPARPIERAQTATWTNTDIASRRDSLRSAYYKVPQFHRESDRFVWIANNDGVQRLASLNDTNQQPFRDAGEGRPATYMGKAIVESMAIATAGGLSTILGGDMGQYVFQEAPDGMVMSQTTEGGEAWVSNTIGVKMVESFDGAPAVPTAFVNVPSVNV